MPGASRSATTLVSGRSPKRFRLRWQARAAARVDGGLVSDSCRAVRLSSSSRVKISGVCRRSNADVAAISPGLYVVHALYRSEAATAHHMLFDLGSVSRARCVLSELASLIGIPRATWHGFDEGPPLILFPVVRR